MTAAIDNVATPGGGRIGLVACPGARAGGLLGPDAAAGLDADLGTITDWGAEALVTLVQPFELSVLGVERLGERARAQGLAWWHLPIVDGAAPGERFEQDWRAEVGPALHERLDRDARVVLHCRAGIGRTGTVAARLLVERGMSPRKAIMAVRRARPGAIENPEQAAWVQACRAR